MNNLEAKPRVLLIQARNTREMERQEQMCFLERCRVEPESLLPKNLVYEALEWRDLDHVDAVMIGGAGEYSAMDNTPWMDNLLSFINFLYENDIPTFGSCWGHQVIARALGGTVIHDTELAELGCGTVQLTEMGKSDPLFGDFPHNFRVNMGHHDRVSVLPPTAVELAFNDTQRNQAFRMRDKPMYGTQFHSELDSNRTCERLQAYRIYYSELRDDAVYDSVVQGLMETTEVDHLLYDFLRKFVRNSES